jgi:hypothetical protein
LVEGRGRMQMLMHHLSWSTFEWRSAGQHLPDRYAKRV